MKKTFAFLSLFTSFSTLICCALPALFIVLGFGAAFAGLISAAPELIWLSEKKIYIFAVGAIMLLIGGRLQIQSSKNDCPVDDQQGAACSATKDWSRSLYFISLGLYFIGAFFTFGLPLIL